MSWFVYEISPIDFGWGRIATVEETVADLEAEAARFGKDALELDAETFRRAWDSAQEAARDHGWAGDHRNEPAVFWLPLHDAFDFGFVIKQDNNGTTYVISPAELPHLT